ncbi:MAG: hypothetical protein IJF02_06220 [Oscillospiraceae bacterium]|nr:hypothetical protein [Oscillospiraceae bacterium]
MMPFKLLKEDGVSCWMNLQNVIPAGYKVNQDMLPPWPCVKNTYAQGCITFPRRRICRYCTSLYPLDLLKSFSFGIGAVLGDGACHVLSIRTQGRMEMRI